MVNGMDIDILIILKSCRHNLPYPTLQVGAETCSIVKQEYTQSESRTTRKIRPIKDLVQYKFVQR